MKKSIFCLALTAFVAGTILTGCNSSGEKVDAAKADLESAEYELQKAKVEYDKEYIKFKMESDKQIADNESQIAELKERGKKMKKETKDAYHKTIEDLEKRNQALKAKIRDYKNEGDEKWKAFKEEFSHDMNELGQSLRGLIKDNVK